MKNTFTTTLAICLAAAPFVAQAENFPRKDDTGSVDSVVVVAIESVQVSKRALIDYGVYDEKEDPAKWAIMQIASRGYNMQRQTTPGLGPMYSIRFIMDRVKRYEEQVVHTFQEKRSIHCVRTEGGKYEALPGTDYRDEATYCLSRPDWKRYEVTATSSGTELGLGADGSTMGFKPSIAIGDNGTKGNASKVGINAR